MFLKTHVLNISWEVEKRGIKKFLNNKRIRRFNVNSGYVFAVRVLFSYKLFPFFFFQRVLDYFIGKIFFPRTEAVTLECSVKKMS